VQPRADDAYSNGDRWIFYIELASALLVLAYTAYVLYDDYGSPGQAQFMVAKCCQKVAYRFGRWGLLAEANYHRILEMQRMI
jgi:hypothetical protein